MEDLFCCLVGMAILAWGHMAGWMQTTLYAPATIGALGLFFSTLIVNFFHMDQSLIIWPAIGTVLFSMLH